jgi:hypothetical protein
MDPVDMDMDMDLGEDRGSTPIQATRRIFHSKRSGAASTRVQQILSTDYSVAFFFLREEFSNVLLHIGPFHGIILELVAHGEQLSVLSARMLARIKAE